jgi:predicted nucleotidyltransferase
MEIDGKLVLKGQGFTSISVNGFKEVYDSGTEETKISTGHLFKVATLPAIVLLKLISFDDRPEQRIKDAVDVGNILRNYFDLQSDLIYSDEYNDLFKREIKDIDEMSAIVIGREINKIIKSNAELYQRIIMILDQHICQEEVSMFVRQMGEENIQATVNLLKAMLSGLTGDY